MTRLPVLVFRYFSVAVNEFYQIVLLLQKININVDYYCISCNKY